MTLSDLPALNACLNGLSAIFLTAGYYFIRHNNRMAHRNCMVSAFVSSTIFLACYLGLEGDLHDSKIGWPFGPLISHVHR